MTFTHTATEAETPNQRESDTTASKPAAASPKLYSFPKNDKSADPLASAADSDRFTAAFGSRLLDSFHK